jgi:hypothetical protein
VRGNGRANMQLTRGLCAVCPVRRECLDDVMAKENPDHRDGFRAGLTANERRAL